MIPERIDQGLAVARWTLQVVGGCRAGISLHGLQRPTEAASAFQQAMALIEQGAHGPVALVSALVHRLVPPEGPARQQPL